MAVLVDTSIWIDYFRGGKQSKALDWLIDENIIAINDIILAELLPFLQIKKQIKAASLLQAVYKLPMVIDWGELINFQTKCLESGANGIGIPDLIIAQNAKQNDCEVYSLDKHFRLLHEVLTLDLYNNEH